MTRKPNDWRPCVSVTRDIDAALKRNEKALRMIAAQKESARAQRR